MKPIIAVLLALPVLGCASSTEIRDGNGDVAQLIECYGNPIGICFDKANNICPDGYALISVDESAPKASFGLYGGTAYSDRSIIVRCEG